MAGMVDGLFNSHRWSTQSQMGLLRHTRLGIVFKMFFFAFQFVTLNRIHLSVLNCFTSRPYKVRLLLIQCYHRRKPEKLEKPAELKKPTIFPPCNLGEIVMRNWNLGSPQR